MRTLQNITTEQLTRLNEVEQNKRVFFDADIRWILRYSFLIIVDDMHLETGDVIEEEFDEFYGPTPFLYDDDEVPRSVTVADC